MLSADEVRAAFVYARNDQEYINPADEEARFDEWLASVKPAEAALHRVRTRHRPLAVPKAEKVVCAECCDYRGVAADWPCSTIVSAGFEWWPAQTHRKGLAVGGIQVCETCPRNVYGAQVAWDDPLHAEAVRQSGGMPTSLEGEERLTAEQVAAEIGKPETATSLQTILEGRPPRGLLRGATAAPGYYVRDDRSGDER